jgi:hypothetical protein
MTRPDLRPLVFLAHLRRFFHTLRFSCTPWRWCERECGCNYDFTSCTPEHHYRPRVMLLACGCGKEFYRDPEFTRKREDEMRRMFEQ